MEQKFERRKGKPTPPVGREFHARQGGRAKVLLIPLKDVLLCLLLHKDQFLKLTNSCCFHTLHEHLPSPVCAHCVCVCVQVRDRWGVCVCVRTRTCRVFTRAEPALDTWAASSWRVPAPRSPALFPGILCPRQVLLILQV